jgi:hypothetical protein
MRHISCVVVSVVAAISVSVLLSVYGAHGTLGAAVYAGYPGGLVNWKLNPGGFSYVLITAVNAAVYLAPLEIGSLLIPVKRSFYGQ